VVVGNLGKQKATSNIERPTSNVEVERQRGGSVLGGGGKPWETEGNIEHRTSNIERRSGKAEKWKKGRNDNMISKSGSWTMGRGSSP
jgi:hypothetical protein